MRNCNSGLPPRTTDAAASETTGSRLTRRNSAVPMDFHSIHVTTCGAFFEEPVDGIIYYGGKEMYIHHVDPTKFTLEDFFMAMHKMKVAFYLPGRVWFSKWGQHWPEGLQSIDTQADLDAMWANCSARGHNWAHIFTQAVDWVMDRTVVPREVTYSLPFAVPAIAGGSDVRGVHMSALERIITERESLGDERIAIGEMLGMRWYVSTERQPKGILPSKRYAAAQQEIGYSRPCQTMQTGFVIEDVFRPRPWRLRLGLEPELPNTYILDENDSSKKAWLNNRSNGD